MTASDSGTALHGSAKANLPGPAPVTGAARIETLDILRGVALFGILVINIQFFAMVHAALVNPTVSGALTGLDYAIWLVSHVLFYEKFLAIFSMLFGAGIVMMAERAEQTGKGSMLALHYRRMFWLLVVGLLHAYLIWPGDILVSYALIGMIIVFMRNWSPRSLVLVGIGFLALKLVIGAWFGVVIPLLPADEIAGIEVGFWSPGAVQLASEIAAYRGGFLEQMPMRVEQSLNMHLFFFPTETLPYSLAMMAFGMAAMKSGLLRGEWSCNSYLRLAATGLVLGLPVVVLGVVMNERHEWDMLFSLYFGRMFNTAAAPLVALAYIALVIVAARRFGPVMRAVFTPVGRMAFSNYLAQSLICTFIFYGHGLGLFMQVDRPGQILVVIAIWVAMPLWSRAWLARFRFGPAEWLWRSLSYRRRQKLMKAL
ncbi:MAG: DUF418 domain-containing protein [Pararhodobacter sp.]|nr:DUF418 domain-containing protein [Pararhodobacter sp.]